MAFNLSPRGINNSKTGHGLPIDLVRPSTPLRQSKKVVDSAFRPELKKETSFIDTTVNAISDAVSGITNYFSTPTTQPKKRQTHVDFGGDTVETPSAAQSYKDIAIYNEDKGVTKSDKSGNFTIKRGLGYTPKNPISYEDTQLNEKVKAFKGDPKNIQKLQKSTDPDVQKAVSNQIEYWNNPEVKKMYLNNHPEYKGDSKSAQQDINTHLAVGSSYEFVPHFGYSKQNKKQIVVASGAAANTFFPGYDQSFKDKNGKITEGSITDNSLKNQRNLKSKNGIIGYTPYDGNGRSTRRDTQSTLEHEFVHGSGLDARQGEVLGKVLGSTNAQPGFNYKNRSKEAEDIGTYMTNKTEMYGNFTEYKKQLHLKPGEKVKDAKQLRQLEQKHLPKGEFNNFSRTFAPERIVKAINTVASNGDKKKTGFKYTGNSDNTYA